MQRIFHGVSSSSYNNENSYFNAPLSDTNWNEFYVKMGEWGAWGARGAPPPQSNNFFENSTIKTNVTPWVATSHLKMKPPPLKCEAPFHEIIPRKSTIINNLKSS